MSQHIFVYGTLLSQYQNHYTQFLETYSKFIGTGYIEGLLYSNNHYPGVIQSNDKSKKVYGQILEISSKTNEILKILDEYEEVGTQFPCPNEYIRSILPVYLQTGVVTNCWVYLYNHSVKDMILIPSGRYQDFIAPRD